MTANGFEYDVFLSHNSADKPVVERIAGLLESKGLKPFLDKWHLVPGDPWQEALEVALDSSNSVAVFLGPEGLSPWHHEEMRVALEDAVRTGKRVIPTLLPGARRDKLPNFLVRRTWVDLSSGVEQVGLLVAGIRGVQPGSRSNEDARRRLGKQLEELYDAKDRTQAEGGDVSGLLAEILGIKRQLRAGPELEAEDLLAGRYRLVRKLGAGGFATVWEAYDRTIRKRVALKILHGQYASDQTRVDRFRRGARVMAGINHPGVVRLLDPWGEDDGHRFFAMQYIEGSDLRGAIRVGNLSPDGLLDIMEQVAEAVAECHRQGLIHRDLKPANILLTEDGRPKVTDFDLVRAADTTGGTRTGALGTVVYTAPECMTNAAAADARSDIYGLSMTAVVGLRGQMPDLPLAYDAPRLVADLPAPEAVRAVLRSGVAVHPEDRQPDVDEWLTALRAARRYQEDEKKPPRETMDEAMSWPTVSGEDDYGSWADVLVPSKYDGVPDATLRMRWIEPGSFLMGLPDHDESRRSHESPQHKVTLTRGFWIAETEITQAVWKAVMGANPSLFRGDDRPVEVVSWNDVQEFLAALNQRVPGLEASLPTEAQWEYACRAGTIEATYGNLGAVAWWGGNSKGETHPVKSKQPNAWGPYDMLGNVWEWCQDRLGPYGSEHVIDPVGPDMGSLRVLRGGSWSDYACDVRAATRFAYGPSFRSDYVGFRLSRGPK